MSAGHDPAAELLGRFRDDDGVRAAWNLLISPWTAEGSSGDEGLADLVDALRGMADFPGRAGLIAELVGVRTRLFAARAAVEAIPSAQLDTLAFGLWRDRPEQVRAVLAHFAAQEGR